MLFPKKIGDKWIIFFAKILLLPILFLSLHQPVLSAAASNSKRTTYRVGILRHPDHAQAQTMFASALSFVNNLGGSVELVPFFVNASTTTENTAAEIAIYHEANEFCAKLCGVGSDTADKKGLVALLTISTHPLILNIAAELGLPVFSASPVPNALAPKIAPPSSNLVISTTTKPTSPSLQPAAITTTLAMTVTDAVTSFAKKASAFIVPRFTTGVITTATPTTTTENSPISLKNNKPIVRYLGPDVIVPMFSLIIRQQWLTFVYIADGKEALERFRILQDRLDRWSNVANRFRMYLICLDQISNPPTLYHATRYLPTEDSPFVDKFILDMSTEKKYDMLLMELKDLGMAAQPYKFYFVHNVITELDLTGFEKGGATFYGYQLVSSTTPLYRSIMRHLYRDDTNNDQQTPFEQPSLTTAEALVFDQVFYLRTLLETLSNNESGKTQMESVSATPVSPNCGDKFSPGFCQLSFLSPLRGGDSHFSVFKAEGLTGWVRFDKEGRRQEQQLSLMELTTDQPLRSVAVLRDDGEWTGDSVREQGTSDGKKTTIIILNVTTIDSPPFLFVRNRTISHRGSVTTPAGGSKRYVINDDEFEGFCVDLADEIGRLLNIKFNFRHVADGQYGAPEPVTKTWNGMIGELIRGEAQVAIAPLTITSTRERVVQMTKPILNTGISIMIKKPEKQQPGVFSFLEPLSSAIWVCTLFAYCGTAVCMWILCRLNNGEMVAPFRNSFWSALCALLGLGGEFSPKSFSGRLLATVWYFFCLILISSYTANMTAFLTVERLEVPVESAEDLVRQDRIQYGTLDSGSTKGFFQTSVNPLYRRMWEVMNETQPGVFVRNVKDGVERVRNSGGRYAFLLESVMNAYYNQRRPCNTMQVGPLLDSKGYGIVTPLGSPWHADLNYAVLYLKEVGVVQQLVTKWWYDKGECPQDNAKQQQDVSGALKLNNVTGVFFILVGGLILGIFFSLLEFAIAAAGLSRRTKVGFPVAARELLSGCILGSANKTIRPLHSLDLLARVLPWVEMPNFSATMLLNRLDEISPRDPRRKYVAAACLRKYVNKNQQSSKGVSRDQTASTNVTKSAVSIRQTANIQSQSQNELFANYCRSPVGNNDIPQPQVLVRSQTFPHMPSGDLLKHINDNFQREMDRNAVCSSETSSSASTSSPSDSRSRQRVISNVYNVRRASSLTHKHTKVTSTTSSTSSTTDDDKQVREIITIRSPSYIEAKTPVMRMPETLQLRPIAHLSMQSRLAFESLQRQPESVSLYEMLTKPELQAPASHLQHVMPTVRPQDLNLSEEERLEQQRWYQYRQNDLTNL